jgi:spermidine synthase
MHAQVAIVACLAFSGFSALVYQVLWTRLLGLAFGTTTEAIGTVLAVFFGGLALGNLLSARWTLRLRHPLRVYAALELAIGVFAVASLPGLERLASLDPVAGGELGPAARALARALIAAAWLLPPTVAMGATLPVVARGLVREDARLGRTSAFLYASNTLGAVLGAYLSGFWMIPTLGVARSLGVAAASNFLVAAVAWRAAPRTAPAPPAVRESVASGARPSGRGPGLFLACFGVSGFVAIGYEIIWSKVFGIVMEGTLYGFAAVLAGFLLGIGLGSAAIGARVDRIRQPARAFALLHLAIAVAVAAGMHAVPYLPWAYQKLASSAGGGDTVHLLFALVLPLVLVPTALFGAAFPLLIRLYSRGAADAGRAIGVATAVNIGGSIAASLAVSFWCIPRLGMDASLYALLLLDLAAALVVLAASEPRPARALAGAGAVVVAVALAFGGVRVDRAIAGREIDAPSLAGYRQELARRAETQTFVAEGRASIVTVYQRPGSRLLRTDGLPEADFEYSPPYFSLSSVLLGVLPYLLAESPERALVIGLGGGNTLRALVDTPLPEIEVVELEPRVVEAQAALYRGRVSPLADPRVRLILDDGRHHLKRAAGGSGARRYDVIASQPSHPWRAGAANLFTEDFFRLVRARLTEGGCFALWINGFSMDPESLLAVVASFERVFPGSQLVDASRRGSRQDLLLIGGQRPLRVDPRALAERLAAPPLSERLALFQIRDVASLLSFFEGPAAAFAALAPGAANTDDNAFVETRVPRRLKRGALDFAELERGLPPGTPVLPPAQGEVDLVAAAEALLARAQSGLPFRLAAKLERLLREHGAALPPARRETLLARARLRDPAREPAAIAALRALADGAPGDPEPLRALGLHLARERGDLAGAAQVFGRAWQRSHSPNDAYDAGRALHATDPARAWDWFQRIPAGQRRGFPRLSLYAAERALARNAPKTELAALRDALLRYRDTEEGREFPLVSPLLARLSHALGDEERARDFEASASRAPGGPGARALARAGEAAQRGDAAGVEAALRELRFWAPSLRAAIGAENRFRSEHGLPLLPELPPPLAAPAA